MAKQQPLTGHGHRPAAADVLHLHLTILPGALGEAAAQIQALGLGFALGLACAHWGTQQQDPYHQSQFHRPGRGSSLDHGLRTTMPQPGQG